MSQFLNLFRASQSLLEDLHFVDVLFKWHEDDAEEPWKSWGVKVERDASLVDRPGRRPGDDLKRELCDFIIPRHLLESPAGTQWPGEEAVISWDGVLWRATQGINNQCFHVGDGHEAQTVRFFTFNDGPSTLTSP